MRVALFHPRFWIAAAILGLTLAGACSLNPQPLPPGAYENGSGDDGSPTFGSSSSSGSGSGTASSDAGLASSSGGGSSSGSSSGTIPTPAVDGGSVAAQDAATHDGGDAATAIDAATDAGLASDGGSDGPSPDAAPERDATGE